MVIEINENGGKQSAVSSAFHKGFPARAALEVAQIIQEGAAKYDVNNWRLISIDDHINHALIHLFELLDPFGNADEDHLAHATCRLMFALDMVRGQHGLTGNRPALAAHVVPGNETVYDLSSIFGPEGTDNPDNFTALLNAERDIAKAQAMHDRWTANHEAAKAARLAASADVDAISTESKTILAQWFAKFASSKAA